MVLKIIVPRHSLIPSIKHNTPSVFSMFLTLIWAFCAIEAYVFDDVSMALPKTAITSLLHCSYNRPLDDAVVRKISSSISFHPLNHQYDKIIAILHPLMRLVAIEACLTTSLKCNDVSGKSTQILDIIFINVDRFTETRPLYGIPTCNEFMRWFYVSISKLVLQDEKFTQKISFTMFRIV